MYLVPCKKGEPNLRVPTKKASSPTVIWHVVGTTRRPLLKDLRLCHSSEGLSNLELYHAVLSKQNIKNKKMENNFISVTAVFFYNILFYYLHNSGLFIQFLRLN